MYVKGKVNSIPVTFTADTGASRTIISTRVFERIEAEQRPELERSSWLVGAGGTPIKEWGKTELTLSLGPLELIKDVIVAEIEDEALLGFDILRGSEFGPVDILLSKNRMIVDGVEIPVFQVSKDKRLRRVTVADDVSVPGKSEAVVSVFIEREEGDDDTEADYILWNLQTTSVAAIHLG